MALPWMRLDDRRPPFAWIALGGGSLSYLVWTHLPILIAATGFAVTLREASLFTLALGVGVLVPVSLISINRSAFHLNRREDERGGKATYSIYLLYWYRLFRGLFIVSSLCLSLLSIIPPWQQSVNQIFPVWIFAFVAFGLVRLIGGLPIIYRWIDRRGVERGFPQESEHYN